MTVTVCLTISRFVSAHFDTCSEHIFCSSFQNSNSRRSPLHPLGFEHRPHRPSMISTFIVSETKAALFYVACRLVGVHRHTPDPHISILHLALAQLLHAGWLFFASFPSHLISARHFFTHLWQEYPVLTRQPTRVSRLVPATSELDNLILNSSIPIPKIACRFIRFVEQDFSNCFGPVGQKAPKSLHEQKPHSILTPFKRTNKDTHIDTCSHI